MLLRIAVIGALIFFYMVPAGAETAVQEVLTWADCLREAARNHPDLIAAREGIVQQEASRSIAGSGRLPQITADANAASALSSKTGSANSFGYGVSGSQLVFDGLKTASNVNAAVQNVEAAKAAYRFSSVIVRYRLRQAFINLLKAQELLVLTAEIRKLRQSNVDLITLRYQSGMEHKGALLTSRANMSQASFEVDRAGRAVESARAALVKELGLAGPVSVRVQGAFDLPLPDLQKPDFVAIANNNPSLQKISAQKKSAEFALKASQGDFWPEVSLTGDVSRSDDHWTPGDQGSSAGVRVSLPLFDGASRRASLDRSRSAYRQLAQEERSAHDSIIVALEQAWNGLNDAAENVNVQRDFLSATEERAKIAEQQYRTGLVSFNDWTIIEDSLVSGKKAFLDARANALLSEASWVQAKGEMLEYEK